MAVPMPGQIAVPIAAPAALPIAAPPTHPAVDAATFAPDFATCFTPSPMPPCVNAGITSVNRAITPSIATFIPAPEVLYAFEKLPAPFAIACPAFVVVRNSFPAAFSEFAAGVWAIVFARLVSLTHLAAFENFEAFLVAPPAFPESFFRPSMSESASVLLFIVFVIF